MKKIFLTAMVCAAFTLQAQNTSKGRPQPPTAEQQMKEFENLNLSSDQKEKIRSLLKEQESNHQRERPSTSQNESETPPPPKDNKEGKSGKKDDKGRKEFDTKLQKILTTKQYSEYKTEQETRRKERPAPQKDSE